LKLVWFAFDLKSAWSVDSQITLGAKAMKDAVRYVAVAMVLVVTGSSSAIAAGQKICSPVTPDKWRAMVPVPREWTAGDCRAFATSVASTDYKLGCIFTDTVGQKYSWSTQLMDVSDPAVPPLHRETVAGKRPEPSRRFAATAKFSAGNFSGHQAIRDRHTP
jgi:hypothetical protein